MQEQKSTAEHSGISAERSGIRPCRPLGRLLSSVSGVMLLLFSSAVVGSAQMVPMRDVVVGQDEASRPVPQTRARRVGPNASGKSDVPAKEDAAVKESDSGAVETRTAPATRVELEEPPPFKEAEKADPIAALREQIKEAKDQSERSRLQHALVDQLIALDQKHEALAELRLMMREERVDPVGLYNIGNALARLGDTDTAIDAYRKAVQQRHGNYSRALNNLGVMLLRQGRWNEAYDVLVAALKQENFRYAEASYNLGRVYAGRGETELAIREWRRTLALQPDHADATLALAGIYLDAGNPALGLAVLDAFAARPVTSSDVASRVAELRRKLSASSAQSALPKEREQQD